VIVDPAAVFEGWVVNASFVGDPYTIKLAVAAVPVPSLVVVTVLVVFV